MAETRPHLRPCPFCHADGEERVYFIKEVAVFSDCEYEAGYTVRCIECGASISDEYSDEVTRLWNGSPKQDDEEDARQSATTVPQGGKSDE